MKHLVMFLLREIIRPVVEEVVAEQMRAEKIVVRLSDEPGPVAQALKRRYSLVSSQKN